MIVMKITIDNNRFMELEAAPDDLEKVDKHFTFADQSECYVYGKFKKENIKYVRYLVTSPKHPTVALMPIGFKQELNIFLDFHKAKYKFYEKRKIETFNFTDEEIRMILWNDDNDIKLRDYQIEAVREMFKVKNGMIKGGTGMGKSEILASWCKLTNKKTLIAFKNIKLAKEIVDRMKKAKIDIGIVQGNNIDENHNVVACTVQSVHKLKRNDYEAIIVDEAHNASQKRYQELLSRNFEYRFGFSATPFNPKNKFKTSRVMAWIGDIIFDKPAKELIEKGHLARPIITFIKIDKVISKVKRQKTEKLYDEDGKVLKDSNGKIKKETKYWYENIEKEINPEVQWSTAEQQGIVYNVYRNKIIKILANSLPGTVLTLVKYVESHGEKLHKEMEDALFLSGMDKIKERELAVEMLEKNEIKTIIASTIFDEGVSINNINNVILVGGGQSYEKTLQRIGRGMRLNHDHNGNITKSKVHIYDFYDETHPTLKKHSNTRIKFAEEEGYEVNIIDVNSLDF